MVVRGASARGTHAKKTRSIVVKLFGMLCMTSGCAEEIGMFVGCLHGVGARDPLSVSQEYFIS